jgi:hypothetical protein
MERTGEVKGKEVGNVSVDNALKASKTRARSPIQGAVKARTCKHCGHHEIGIVTKSGKYLPLELGIKIMILQESQKE